MYPGAMAVEPTIPESVRQELRAKGHKLTVAKPWTIGSNAAIMIDPQSGVLSAGSDPRVEACAWAR